MKILVVHASAGGGHKVCAEALSDAAGKFVSRGDRLVFADVIDYTTPFFHFCYHKGYNWLVHYLPWFWQVAFYLTDHIRGHSFTASLADVFNRLHTKRFNQFLIAEQFDIIISTHFLPSGLAVSLKKTRQIKSKIVTVITDFGVHDFWIAEGTDVYAVASSFTKELLIAKGVPAESIIEPGIPIGAKFNPSFDRKALALRFGIDPEKFTALVITGSFGSGPIEEIVESLREKVQLLVVCARNKRLFNCLSSRGYLGVKIFGFIHNVEELMAVSDMIITKPGGLSISELLAMELVPVFIAAIPGQEQINASILQHYGVGLIPRDILELKNIVQHYQENPTALGELKEKVRAIKRPFAAQEVVRCVMQK